MKLTEQDKERWIKDFSTGHKFEHFVRDTILAETGEDIELCQDLADQIKYGDSRAGIEIKSDSRFQETGNYFIEHVKCNNVEQDKWLSSAWKSEWLCIGSLASKSFVIISTKDLEQLVKRCRYVGGGGGRTKGWVVPVRLVKQYASEIYENGKLINRAEQ